MLGYRTMMARYGHCTSLYDSFYRWCCHQNKETKYAGFAAMDAFLKEIAQFIQVKSTQSAQVDVKIDCKAIFKGADVNGDQTEMFQARTSISYKDYLVLWEHLLDKKNDLDQDSSVPNPSDNDKDSVSLSDPVAGLQPRVQKDVLVFINLVEFCKAVLPCYRINSFERWIYVFGRDIIVMSSRFPVISGFYKLLQLCMKICKDLKFFKDIKMEKQKTAEDMDIEIADNSDCTNCFVLFRKFVKEVLVRMKQYKDDLLSSCLELVLSLPHEMVFLDVSSIVPALEQTFKLGLSYPPLAQVGLDALESWNTNLPSDVLAPYFKNILPCFDGYLKSIAESGVEESNQETKKTITMTTTTSSSRGRKIPVKLLKSSRDNNESTDGPLTKIRHQMLRLLGRLGGRVNTCLLGSDIDPSRAVAWDTANHLSFAVPFQDMKPTIYLDPFLPRVVELATTSSDRQTKVHKVLLFDLGEGRMML
ncbi:hypothetical protein QZH41_002351 [Actinostola sp. cb2023]|nr:hypothetical protein QZH41_002351 [Actinostola sp. cb2023]